MDDASHKSNPRSSIQPRKILKSNFLISSLSFSIQIIINRWWGCWVASDRRSLAMTRGRGMLIRTKGGKEWMVRKRKGERSTRLGHGWCPPRIQDHDPPDPTWKNPRIQAFRSQIWWLCCLLVHIIIDQETVIQNSPWTQCKLLCPLWLGLDSKDLSHQKVKSQAKFSKTIILLYNIWSFFLN